MLTKDDLLAIKKIIQEAVEPLATKIELAKLDTKITKLDVKITGQFAQLSTQTAKDVERLEKAIKTEYKRGNEDFGYLESEDRKISVRVARIERHLNFAIATA